MKRRRNQGWVVLCVVALCTGGCFTQRAPRASIAQRVNLRPPVIPAVKEMELEAPPEIPLGAGVMFPELLTARSVPPRPRVATAPAAETGKAEKQAEPGIAPEFSTQEAQEAKFDTQRNLELTEKNLTLAGGRSLNASQQDLVSKTRGFAENAREAMKAGDWVRAKNLSRKAEVLSEELADSL